MGTLGGWVRGKGMGDDGNHGLLWRRLRVWGGTVEGLWRCWGLQEIVGG